MSEKQMGCLMNVIWLVIVLIGVYIYTLVFCNGLYKTQTALLETGVKTEATAEIVTHKGILEWGKIYVKLDYQVDGDDYSSDIPISTRTYKLPGGKVKNGLPLVTVSYDEEDPSQVAFEGVAQSAKSARTISIVMLCVMSAIAIFLILGYIAVKMSN